MKKFNILANAIAMVLASASMGANAQNTTYVGNLSSTYNKSASVPIFAWDGSNNTVAGKGWGWGHNAAWYTFTLTAPTALDITMTTSSGGNFNSAFTVWQTAGYTDPVGSIGNGHSFSQVSTDSSAGNGTIPWLTDPAEGGVTGFVGYANSGPSGWKNAAGLTVGKGTELNGTGLVDTVTVGNQNAELLTKVLPAGKYLMAVGGSYACGSFLSNNLGACPTAGGGNYSLTINQVAASTTPVREDNDGDKHADILWYQPQSVIAGAGYGDVYELLSDVGLAVPAAPINVLGQFAGVPIPSAFTIKGRGDYNGDGKSDILWGNSSNQLYVVLRTGASSATYNIPAAPLATSCAPATSVVVGTGDYNGDNISDILLQNSSGSVSVLLMNGTTILNAASCATTFATPPTNTSIVKGTGDYNGDGKADILWSNGTGQADVQYTGVTGTTSLSGLTGLNIQGSGNFDGDSGHKSDLLLSNAARDVSIKTDVQASPSTSGTPISAPFILVGANVPPGWVVKGTGDYDGDGKNDILWRNEDPYNSTTNPMSGYNFVFLMNGVTVRTTANSNQPSDFLTAPYNNIPTSLGWDIVYTQTQ